MKQLPKQLPGFSRAVWKELLNAQISGHGGVSTVSGRLSWADVPLQKVASSLREQGLQSELSILNPISIVHDSVVVEVRPGAAIDYAALERLVVPHISAPLDPALDPHALWEGMKRKVQEVRALAKPLQVPFELTLRVQDGGTPKWETFADVNAWQSKSRVRRTVPHSSEALAPVLAPRWVKSCRIGKPGAWRWFTLAKGMSPLRGAPEQELLNRLRPDGRVEEDPQVVWRAKLVEFADKAIWVRPDRFQTPSALYNAAKRVREWARWLARSINRSIDGTLVFPQGKRPSSIVSLSFSPQHHVLYQGGEIAKAARNKAGLIYFSDTGPLPESPELISCEGELPLATRLSLPLQRGYRRRERLVRSVRRVEWLTGIARRLEAEARAWVEVGLMATLPRQERRKGDPQAQVVLSGDLFHLRLEDGAWKWTFVEGATER